MDLSLLWILLLVLAVMACILGLKRSWMRKQEIFLERFPPISDEEFMARCARGTNPRVALAVRRIMADALYVEYERIYPTSRLINDLEAE